MQTGKGLVTSSTLLIGSHSLISLTLTRAGVIDVTNLCKLCMNLFHLAPFLQEETIHG